MKKVEKNEIIPVSNYEDFIKKLKYFHRKYKQNIRSFKRHNDWVSRHYPLVISESKKYSGTFYASYIYDVVDKKEIEKWIFGIILNL